MEKSVVELTSKDIIKQNNCEKILEGLNETSQIIRSTIDKINIPLNKTEMNNNNLMIITKKSFEEIVKERDSLQKEIKIKCEEKNKIVPEKISETNLKILIRKESEIRDLRLQNNKLKDQNNDLLVQLERINQENNNFNKEKKINSQNNHKETEITNGKKASKINKKFEKISKLTKNPQKSILINQKNEKPAKKSNTLFLKNKKINKNSSTKIILNKKFSKQKRNNKNNFQTKLNLLRTPTRPIIIKKNLERSASEPKRKTKILNDDKFSTPLIKKKINKIKNVNDDPILNTIKFKKTKSLFRTNRSTKTIKKSETTFKGSLTGQLDETFLILSNKNVNWNDRVNQMTKMEKIISSRSINLTKDQLNLMKNVLVIQIYDLRSAVVKRVCSLISVTSRLFSVEIGLFVSDYLNALFSRVYNSTRAIRDPCCGAIEDLVLSCRRNGRILKDLINFCVDPHNEVRRLAIKMVGVCIKLSLIDGDDHCFNGKYRLPIETALLGLMRDANKDVRKETKKTFNLFRKKWPENSKKLFQKFDNNVKKSLIK